MLGSAVCVPAAPLPFLSRERLPTLDENSVVFFGRALTGTASSSVGGVADGTLQTGWCRLEAVGDSAHLAARPVFAVEVATVPPGQVWLNPVLHFNVCHARGAGSGTGAAALPALGPLLVSLQPSGAHPDTTSPSHVASEASPFTCRPPGVPTASRLVLREVDVDLGLSGVGSSSEDVDAALRAFFAAPRVLAPGDVFVVPVSGGRVASRAWDPCQSEAFDYRVGTATRAVAVYVEAVDGGLEEDGMAPPERTLVGVGQPPRMEAPWRGGRASPPALATLPSRHTTRFACPPPRAAGRPGRNCGGGGRSQELLRAVLGDRHGVHRVVPQG
jgi:hypothetical protein